MRLLTWLLVLYVLLVLGGVWAFGQRPAKDGEPVKPEWTLEPATHWVPHCPKGTEPWYEPKGDGCGAAWLRIGPEYLDHRIDPEPKRDEVECRPAGSQPKKLAPTACPL